jgi:hypothetical protein
MSKSLQQKIKDIRTDQDDDDQSDIHPEEYENLILDEIKIERLTEEDGKYLATFNVLDSLSMNQTQLKSLENFPQIKNLKRLELAENHLTGEELKGLAQYAATLETLKLANNKITKIEDLDHLKALKCLKNLDLEQNDVCDLDGYKEQVWQMFEKLEVLDHLDKEGKEAFSDDDVDYDDEDAGQDGKNIFIDDMYGDEGFEGGEDDMDDFEGDEDELSEEAPIAKRQKK